MSTNMKICQASAILADYHQLILLHIYMVNLHARSKGYRIAYDLSYNHVLVAYFQLFFVLQFC